MRRVCVIAKAMDMAKQAKVAEVLGSEFVGRGRSSMLSPTDATVSYEKLDRGREDEVHLGLDLTRDAVSRLVPICQTLRRFRF